MWVYIMCKIVYRPETLIEIALLLAFLYGIIKWRDHSSILIICSMIIDVLGYYCILQLGRPLLGLGFSFNKLRRLASEGLV